MNRRLIYIIGVVLLLFSPIRVKADEVITYQYWIDNDISAVVESTTTDGAEFTLPIDVANLSTGVHFLNVRAKTGTTWGTVYRYLFSIPTPANPATVNLQKYEYWLDNDYANRVTTEISGTTVSPVLQLDDGWTIVTEDGTNAAHYENTILITEKEPEVLTLL